MTRLKTKRLVSAFSMVVVLLAMVSAGGGEVTIFLSDKGHGEGATLGNPHLILPSVGATDSVYLWIKPDDDPNKTLIGAGLDVLADDANVIDRTSSTVFNPDIWVDALNADSGDDRWNTPVNDGNGYDLVHYLRAIAVTEEGINPTYDGTVAPLYYRDLLYDSGPDAFLYAKIDFQATAVGSTDLWIVINDLLVAPDVGSSGDLDIIFGANETTILHGNDDYIKSAVRDGFVIVPEPVTLSLLAFSGLALIRWRK